jgi:hypothetical protein
MLEETIVLQSLAHKLDLCGTVELVEKPFVDRCWWPSPQRDARAIKRPED